MDLHYVSRRRLVVCTAGVRDMDVEPEPTGMYLRRPLYTPPADDDGSKPPNPSNQSNRRI